MRARKLSHLIGRAAAAAGFGMAATLGLASSTAAAEETASNSDSAGTLQAEVSGDITPDTTWWE